MKTKSYQEFLRQELSDPDLAARYLSASIEGGDVEEFLLALRNVADAHGGLGTVSEITSINRQGLYKMLSEEGNPTLGNLVAILRAVGVNIVFESAVKEAA